MRTLAELVRLPAALSVLGDTAVGAAAAGRPLTGRRLGLPLSSAALYLAGMALNDWADRDLDAVERPERPIPSGLISPGAALGVATTLTGAGLALAALGGGRDALRIAVPLAASVWTYDTLLKNTPAAPLGMAVCRGLDVLLGAGARSARAAAPGALAMAAHTAGVTTLAQGEVHGTSRVAAGVALTTTTASTALAVLGPARGGWHRAGAVLAAAGYARTVGGAQLTAARDTSAANARAATGVGIRGMIPLQAALVARRGSLAVSAALAGLVPLGRRLARRVSQT
ncbi:SCO3242 family prenyltransferase [Actinoalloteichus caeruleus]|uniref:SCO3242 family prenyltransferase n=1 Tax=Actinoalloteichus cyanogriseus TaxID=2893586 RepID=UPI003BB99E63